MPDLSPQAIAALPFWSVIEGAAADRATTADLWSALQDAAESRGLSSPGVTIQGVSELRSYAAGLQNASDRLNTADPGNALSSAYIAQAPWSRDLAAQATVGNWQVRFQHTTSKDGVESTDWRTVVFTGQLPPTVGELGDAISADAENMAAAYGTENGSVGALSIIAI